MVTKFGGQIMATKFGFVPDCKWSKPCEVDVDKMEIETLRMKLKVYDLTNVWINMDLAILIFQYTFVLI